MCAFEDISRDCWVGPDKHSHRQFETQCSSPFWTNKPDPEDPKYCLITEDISEKPKETTWEVLTWKAWHMLMCVGVERATLFPLITQCVLTQCVVSIL